MKNSFSKAVFSFKTGILKPKLEDLFQKSESSLGMTDLSTLNFKKRQLLLKHALEHSSFYKEKYKGLNLNGAGLRTPEDFLKIPPLTREDLQANFESIKADNVSPRNYRKVTTSGSTGFPVSTLQDRRHPETPIRWRILQWWKCNRGKIRHLYTATIRVF